MDEMRQLVRIMTKIFPKSVSKLNQAVEAEAGENLSVNNKVSEEQINFYLEAVLGMPETEGGPPRPHWGLPHGWKHYIAREWLVWGP